MKMYEPIKDKKTQRFVKKYNDGYGARNTTLTVSISDELKNEVKALAKKNNESLSNMVNIILADHLKGNNFYIEIGSGVIALTNLEVSKKDGTEFKSGGFKKQYTKGQPIRPIYIKDDYIIKEVL